MPSLDDWNNHQAEVGGITTAELDSAATAYDKAYAAYEEAKEKASALHKIAQEAEKKFEATMDAAGKTKYIVEGQGTYYFINKMTVPTPKSNDDKRALFAYIKEKHGAEFLTTLTSINHQTLQSFYKAEFEEAAANENVAVTIPGLQEPTAIRSIGFRKEKK